MNYFNQYFMPCITGILGKQGASLKAGMQVANPFTLSSFARGNAVTRRIASIPTPTIKYHRSRIMGGF